MELQNSVTETIQYGSTDPEAQTLDLFLPDAEPNGRCILWVHGGGWYAGSRTQWYGPARWFCDRGTVCATMDYRLVPGALFPAQIEDVRLAMASLRTRASELGVSPRSIAVAGSSAGGHLAALLGTIGPDDPLGVTPELTHRDTRPDAVICYCPVTTLFQTEDPTGKLRSITEDLMGCTEQEAPDRYRKASPRERIAGTEPPFLFLHGNADALVPPSHSEMMARRLRDAGGQADVLVIPGAQHGFGYGVATEQQQIAVAAMETFLDRIFSDKPL